MSNLTIEQRRQMIIDAGVPKKGHHWAIWFDWNNGSIPTIAEWKTQFQSTDGSLVAHRVSREQYTIIDRKTSYVVASVPGRTYAKGLIEELGPTWAETIVAVLCGDMVTVNRVKELVQKYKSIVS